MLLEVVTVLHQMIELRNERDVEAFPSRQSGLLKKRPRSSQGFQKTESGPGLPLVLSEKAFQIDGTATLLFARPYL